MHIINNKVFFILLVICFARPLFAETNLDTLKSMAAPHNVLITVKNSKIPKSPRILKGLYDEEKYGDWLLDVNNLGGERKAGVYIDSGAIVHIYTYDQKNRGHILHLSCTSGLISDGGINYSVLAKIKSGINASGKIKDFSKYYYMVDDSEGEFQESLRFADNMDKMVALGATSEKSMRMINYFKKGREFYGMLDVNLSKQVFKFSLKGFTKAYSEMQNRCLKFSYVTYNRVFR